MVSSELWFACLDVSLLASLSLGLCVDLAVSHAHWLSTPFEKFRPTLQSLVAVLIGHSSAVVYLADNAIAKRIPPDSMLSWSNLNGV